MLQKRDIKKLLGLRIAKLRKIKGFSQEKFAEALNISSRSLSRIETGVNYPLPKTLNDIANALALKPKDLYDFECEYNNKELYSSIIDRIKSKKNDIDKLKLINEILEKIL